MALLRTSHNLILGPIKYMNSTFKSVVRTLVSKQLIYSQFGNPLEVVKYRQCQVPKLESTEVLVRMLAAPVNPADINTIQGKNRCLPSLPCVPGDEGVGEVLEIGRHVGLVEPGQRVVFNSRLLGTWRYYGIFHERHLQVISPLLTFTEASMLTLSPCTALRMIRDFRWLKAGDTIVQNGANSAVGQSVVQFCKLAGIHTINIVSSHLGYSAIKKHLLKLGATQVYTLDEAEDLTVFNTSIRRPILALNCLGGKYEDVILKILASKGTAVYYGCAYDIPFGKRSVRPDVNFQRFSLWEWDARARKSDKEHMLNEIIRLMVIGKFQPPLHKTIEIQDYVCVFRNTAPCEAFSTFNYVFDFTNQL